MSQNQKIEALNRLLDRMEEIQIDIEESSPPDILIHIITKWEDECRLNLQAIFLLVQGIDRSNLEWISEAYELLQEAENKRVKWKDELLNLLSDNGIETESAPLNSIYGMTTKRDLTGLGNFMFMGLIGIIIATVVNIFLKSPAVATIVSYIGVLVFVGLTAYDTQHLRNMAMTQPAGLDAGVVR
ncbi:MAG: Bax inhibitor-1/YccA family protein, partial [Dehalococcoidia bacterium]